MNKSTIWPAVMARMSPAAIEATRPRISIEWIKAILLVTGAAVLSGVILWWTL